VIWQAVQGAETLTAHSYRHRRSFHGRLEVRRPQRFLEDETLLSPARQRILGGRMNAARAWTQTVSPAAATWKALDDRYSRSRAADLRRVGDQVLRRLLGLPASQEPVGGGILVTPNPTPAQVAALERSSFSGVVCALGIPAVAALGPPCSASPRACC
jgi:phosphoenolpyruvate-protein kinase (PTS system EI component)